MTLPADFPGGVWGDGSTDERWGVVAARGAAGFGSAATDGGGCGTAAGARAAPGVPAVESVSERGCAGFDLETARSCEQPAQARGSSHQGVVGDSRAVLGFWPDPSGREAARSASDHPRP